jgi:hypothetical protein
MRRGEFITLIEGAAARPLAARAAADHFTLLFGKLSCR